MKKRVEKSPKEKADRGMSGVEEELALLGTCDQMFVSCVCANEYQCCGILEADFPEVCALLGMREVPLVTLQPRGSEGSQFSTGSGKIMRSRHLKPCLEVDLETEDPRSVREIRVFGWKLNKLMMQALRKTLPSLSNLQKLHLWRAGLTGQMLKSLKTTVSLCVNLRTVILEGTPIPEEGFHILIAENSTLAHLSLRNNHIGESGVRLIGAALSTPYKANKSLLSLNLTFNCIGDAGAKHIAQGLRLNRTLLCLSMAFNNIGDAGAADLAEVLGPFALTHEEVVERRRQLNSRDSLVRLTLTLQPKQTQTAESKNLPPLSVVSSSSLEQNLNKLSKSTAKKKETSKKDEKQSASQGAVAAGKKEETKLTKKVSDTKTPRGKGIKPEGKEKLPFVSEQENHILLLDVTHTVTAVLRKLICYSQPAENPETLSALLEPGVQHIGGSVLLPGNNVLASLNLSGNKLTEQSVCLFLSSLERQAEGRGLLRLSLSRNCFVQDCETFLKLKEVMALRDPLNRSSSIEEEHGQAASLS
ncbi:leucine-rich repeat-containing protein 71 isoform X2 [Arapaima gigas]